MSFICKKCLSKLKEQPDVLEELVNDLKEHGRILPDWLCLIAAA